MGSRLGRYEVVKPLAEGGMAEVLIARTTGGVDGFERHVVIKRIRAEQAKDPEYVKMFVDEARLAASLHHHNIVQVHDIGEADGEYFFAMEYIHGEDLRRMLTVANGEQTQLPFAQIVTIVAQAAAGLHHAHEQLGPDRQPLRIVHRDVSPANIIVGYDGSVKVVDFGIAKAALRSQETRSGTLKGKVSYMSPEQCVGAEIDRRSDVFALGIVLYELVTVRRLFKGHNDFVTMATIVAGNVPPPSAHRPDLPAGLEAIILKALSLKPENRYASCDEMRRALEAFADQAGMQTSAGALGAYLEELVGTRPLPWESDDVIELESLDPDFDGTEPGMATADVLALPPDIVPRNTSPLMRAQAGTSPMVAALRPPATPRPPTARPPTPLPVVLPASNDSPRPVSAADSSGTPMTWVPVFPEATPRPRNRLLLIGTIAASVSAIALVLAIASRGDGEPDAESPHPAVQPAREPAPPQPPPSPPPAPPPAPPKAVVTGSGSDKPEPRPAAKKPRPAAAKPAAPKCAHHDPNSLFPSKCK